MIRRGNAWMPYKSRAGLGTSRVGLGGPETDPAVQLAYTALAASPTFCDPTACLVVEAFQTAWNAAGGSLAVSGVYETTTQSAAAEVATVLGGATAPPACTAPYANCASVPAPTTPSPPAATPSVQVAGTDYTAPILFGAGILGTGIIAWALLKRRGPA